MWAAATALREKYVKFVVPRTFTEKEMDHAYQQSGAYTWEDGKAAEKHRVFLFSSDLLHQGQRGQGRQSGRMTWGDIAANSYCPSEGMPICSSSATGGPGYAARHWSRPQQRLLGLEGGP